MSEYIVHSSISENGNTGWDGKAKSGDQTGKEVCIRTWYSKPWDMILRYPDIITSNKARTIAIKLANSNLVGYDQSQRNTLYKQLEANNWDVDKYIASCVKTESDCSSFVYAVYCCILPELRGQSNAPRTADAEKFYRSKGFMCYKTSEYTKTTSKLVKGDLLNKAGSHIVMYIGSDKDIDEISDRKTNYEIAQEVIKGLWGNGDERKKLLTEYGYDYKAIQDEVNNIQSKKGVQSNNNIIYYKKYDGKSKSIVQALNKINENSSYSNRKTIAKINGIENYKGTCSQNIKLLSLLKQGKLIKSIK